MHISIKWASRQSTCRGCSSEITKGSKVVVGVVYSKKRGWAWKSHWHVECWLHWWDSKLGDPPQTRPLDRKPRKAAWKPLSDPEREEYYRLKRNIYQTRFRMKSAGEEIRNIMMVRIREWEERISMMVEEVHRSI